MVKGRVVIIGVLPGIDRHPNSRRYSLITKSASGTSHAGADGLQYKYNAVCPGSIKPAQVHIKLKIE